MEVLNKPYATEQEAVNAIASHLDGFYRTNYTQLYAQRADTIKSAIGETQRIFKTYFFPEMKTNWATHPNNIGHLYSSGCFRCHDGKHKTADGKRTIKADDCNSCHTILAQGSAEELGKMTPAGQAFKHPGGDIDPTSTCNECHDGTF